MQQEIERNTRLVESLDEIFDELRVTDEESIQTVTIADGREVMFVRPNAMTVSRLYITGRPDGKRPHGRDSYFDYFQELLEEHRAEYEGDERFELAPEEWQLLFREGADRYVRYLFFSTIKRWRDVERDTEINLKLCRMAKDYAPDDIAWQIYQYMGYILMMNTMARAEQRLMRNEQAQALAALDDGIQQIGQFCAECLREQREDTENVTREHYLNNLVQYRADLESVEQRLTERMTRHTTRRVNADDLEDLFDEEDDDLDEVFV